MLAISGKEWYTSCNQSSKGMRCNLDSIITWFRQLQFGGLLTTVIMVAASLLCITVHETCHGLTAYWLGDPTARNAGRLTLNPIRHVDLVGLIMMAILHFGWAKPVPVDMRNFKNPKGGMALTALAGPVSNVLLAVVALLAQSVLYFFLMRRPDSQPLYYGLLFTEYVALISAGLAVFNIIPISPLDGSKVLMAFLPSQSYFKLMRYEHYGMFLLMALLLLGWLDAPLVFLRDHLLSFLRSGAVWPLELLWKFSM